jgi:mannose-6-phosphate isomerase-like protein (cupin superfamily)
MRNIERRAFLGAAITALPLALIGQSIKTTTQTKASRISSGEDRFGEHRTLGVSSTDFKVSTQDSGGGLFIMEHTNRKKGGPTRHLHHNQDEWWYAIEGEYIVEVGSERFRLHPGDSILGPREVPHAWAFVGDTHGKLLIAFAPANRMEEYFRRILQTSGGAYPNPNNAQEAQVMREYGMELIGPPLSLE